MSTADEQNQDIADDAADSIEIPIGDLIATIWQRRRWLAMVTGLGLVLAIGYALSIPNVYTSTAQLMPADQQSLSSTSVLSPLVGAGSIGTLGGLMSMRTSGGTIIGILSSQTEQDDIINRLDLLHVYHCKLYVDARNRLLIRP